MKITIPRDVLAPALASLSRVVERRNTIPVLSNILLRADGGKLALCATDLDIKVETSVPCEVAEAGAITLPAHTLSDIVRKLPAEAAITLDGGEKGMALKSGPSRFTLQTLPESDFPDIADGEFTCSFALPAKTLAQIVEVTSFAISTEETRYYLNGIHMHAMAVEGATVLRAVATDGHKLSRLQLPAPAGAEAMPAVIVPRKTVAELAKIAKEAEGDLTIELSPTKIRVTAGATTLTSKLIDGTFPDYQRVIPSGNDKVATLAAEAFKQAIDRVATISSERGRAVKLGLTPGSLTLSVTNPDSGSATEELTPDYDGTAIEIGFNARYLLDILGVLGGDSLQLKLSEPGAPAILQRREGDSLLVVLMPMRV
ncbi:DNA polymerase III subunit beta [Bosea sp. ANAM02]|uniref:DNA polymerase III subunit beta n=1 Tax=Bosea sp. ANAM02 TaxID=2020412 RepID=UPI00140ED9E8|nr:DNA polymerase III subunit beta [Bosea sp. ANAM02]BCB18023.1 DNA polymerase III subunit beta [Bosea sp. ANAM02]